MGRLTPRPAQEEAIQQMLGNPSCAVLLGAHTGAGKSLMAAEVTMRLEAKTVLIIGPLNVDEHWKTTFANQGSTLPFKHINSTPKGLAAFTELKKKQPGIYYIGREFFSLSGTDAKPKKKPDGTYTKGRKARWSWKTVKPDVAIADELHSAQNRKTSNAKALHHLKAGYKLGLSATAAGNKFQGLWSVTRWLWPDIVPLSFWKWANQWAIVGEDYSSGRAVMVVEGERNPGAYVSSLPCYIKIGDARPEPKTVRFDCPLTPEQEEQYQSMKKNMLTWIDDNPLVPDLPISQTIRLRQMSLAAVSLDVQPNPNFGKGEDEQEWIENVYFEPDAPSGKIDRLLQIIDANPDEPMLLFTDSQKFARIVTSRVNAHTKGRTLGIAAEWSGHTNKMQREHIKEHFGRGVQYIVAVIPAIAEGVDGLQHHARIMVWMNKSTNGMLNQQAAGRLNRSGQTKQVVSVELVSEKTKDLEQLTSLALSAAEMKRILEGIK